MFDLKKILKDYFIDIDKAILKNIDINIGLAKYCYRGYYEKYRYR